MHSNKDTGTVVIVTGSPNDLAKVMSENTDNWTEIKKPELNDVLLEADRESKRPKEYWKSTTGYQGKRRR